MASQELQQFFAVFQLTEPRPPYRCRCPGQLTLLFYAGDERIAEFTYHHDTSFRSSFYQHGNLDIVPEYRIPIKQFFPARDFRCIDLRHWNINPERSRSRAGGL